ncbi:MAG: precorrin-8X methylmutase [Hyphomicrobiales bacterium]
MELIDRGAVGRKPAAVIAFPVGFVGAAESKDELVRDPIAAWVI